MELKESSFPVDEPEDTLKIKEEKTAVTPNNLLKKQGAKEKGERTSLKKVLVG